MANILSRRNLFRGAAGAALGAAAASIAAVSASAQPNAIAVAELAEFESDGIVDEIVARLTPSVGELVVLDDDFDFDSSLQVLSAPVAQTQYEWQFAPLLSQPSAASSSMWVGATDDGAALVELEQVTEITIELDGEWHLDLATAGDLEAWLNSPSHVSALTLR